MLGKLMKYEWRGLRGPLIIMLCVLFGTTLLSCMSVFTINSDYDDVVLGLSIFALLISWMLYYFGIIGSSIGIMVIIAIRFYKTCYTDQGYLTHTLPVTPKQLLLAKTIVSALCSILVSLCIVVSLAIFVPTLIYHILGEFSEVSELYSDASSYYRYYYDESLFGYIVHWAITGLISCVCSVINIFGCVSLGQLYTKHRVIGAILAYFILNIIETFIGYLTVIPTVLGISAAQSRGDTLSLLGLMTPFTTTNIIISIVIAVALFFVNLHMMTKRLNLE